MKSLVLSAILLCASTASNSADSVAGSRILFMDNSFIQSLRGVSLKMHSPTPREVAIRFDAPWEETYWSGYVTVLRDGDDLRMYYRGGGGDLREVTCLATSRDGIIWQKPDLGLYEHNGSKNNNIVFTGKAKAYWESHNFTPFIDTKPGISADQRYKALGLGRHVLPDGEDVKALVALVSVDGIHWKHLQDKPIITEGSFDSQNVAFWDSVRNTYVGYFRAGRDGYRAVRTTNSDDFINWSAPEWIGLGDTQPEQFYTNAISPYPLDPAWYIGMPMRFVPQRKTVGNPPKETDGVSDGVLITSRDGINFNRQFLEAFIRPGLNPHNWGAAHGNNTPAWGILQTSPTELSVYWSENYLDMPQVRRGALRIDGFASANAGAKEGVIVTKPISVAGDHLLLNMATSATGWVKVELLDTAGKPIEGFTLSEAEEIFGDEISRKVAFRKPLADLANRQVRVKLYLKDADLFSIRFTRPRRSSDLLL